MWCKETNFRFKFSVKNYTEKVVFLCMSAENNKVQNLSIRMLRIMEKIACKFSTTSLF